MTTEKIQYLIDAEDKASAKIRAASQEVSEQGEVIAKTQAQVRKEAAATERKAAQVIKSLKSPMDVYEAELAQLISLQKAGKLSTDQLAAAQENLKAKFCLLYTSPSPRDS